MKPSAEQQALISLIRANGRVRRQFGNVLGASGLGSSQYNILRILRGAREPLPIMTIRDRMIDVEPSITRLVDRLEERGLVARTRSTEDRRRVACRLTAAGRALVDRLDGPVDRRDRELMGRLSKAELKTLVRLLDKVGLPE